MPDAVSPPAPPPTGHHNRVLAALPAGVRADLAPDLERVHLNQSQVIYDPYEAIAFAYFPLGAVCSTLTLLEDGSQVESLITGMEGMVGIPLTFGLAEDTSRCVCQIAGPALRLPAAVFRRTLARNGDMFEVMGRVAQMAMSQMMQSAGCTPRHPIDDRAARWILMAHDRVGDDTFVLTHEYLGRMLGVRRQSVSLAAGALQHAGLITYERGRITVRDRPGLEAAACECYRILREMTDRYLPPVTA